MFANTTLLRKASTIFRIISWIYLVVIPIFLFALLRIGEPEILGRMFYAQYGFIPDWIFWGIIISTQLEKFIGYITVFLLLRGVALVIDFLLTFVEKMKIGEESDASAIISP